MKISIRPKQILHMLFDAFTVNFAFFLAFYFRFGKTVFANFGVDYWKSAAIITPCFRIAFAVFRFYKTVWFHAGVNELIYGVFANVVAGLIIFSYEIFARHIFLPLVVLATILSALMTIGSRMTYRIILQIILKYRKSKQKCERVMIIGAGDAAVMAIREMHTNKTTLLSPVCAIDDREDKIGKFISGIPVVGNINSICRYAKEKEIDTIIIAIPSLSLNRKKYVIDICKKTGCTIKTMPSIYEIISGGDIINKLRE